MGYVWRSRSYLSVVGWTAERVLTLGSDDAMWMERKDVPIDYEMSGLES
jgi:hypothetical protein